MLSSAETGSRDNIFGESQEWNIWFILYFVFWVYDTVKGGMFNRSWRYWKSATQVRPLPDFVNHSDSLNHRCFRSLNASILADEKAFSIIFEFFFYFKRQIRIVWSRLQQLLWQKHPTLIPGSIVFLSLLFYISHKPAQVSI